MKHAHVALIFATICVACTAGQPNPASSEIGVDSRPGGTPPPEAFAACLTSAPGEACTVETPRGKREGTCETARGSEQQVCRIERGGQDGRQGGPQGQEDRQMRVHMVTQTDGPPTLYPAIVDPITTSEMKSYVEGDWRYFVSNSISQHKTGMFPNPGNPNAITEFPLRIRIPFIPVYTGQPTRIKDTGLGLNGVSFDPGAGEFYRGDPRSGWQYNALSGALPFGLDANHAHVQPTGKYHYHGLPTGLIDRVGKLPGGHSAQLGWAADGFPIFGPYGPAPDGSGIRKLTSSYKLKPGNRPSGGDQPGGVYDGTFVADYEYVSGSGDLDECNGMRTVTPDYPNGTYAYFLTEHFPVVPRCVMGTPDIQTRRSGPRP